MILKIPASARRIALLVSLVVILSGCDWAEEGLADDIPTSLPTNEIVYSHGELMECAVAIHSLEEEFASALRIGGIDYLTSATGEIWRSASLWELDDGGRWVVDAMLSLECIKDDELHDVFMSTANDGGGYILVQESNSVSIIDPSRGLVMVGGYE